MTLTLPGGPLSPSPPGDTNYELDGPAHKLLATPFPRRVRARLGERTVLDTTDGVLVHETAILPVLYAPIEDLDRSALVDSDLSTHCPFKGDASYWSVQVDDRTATDAVWYYPAPNPEAVWLAGRAACYWDRFDAWFDEDELVEGHLRDPYHRVDVRRSSRHVRVTVGGEVVAESNRPMVLSENNVPNRWYLPPADVRFDRLASSTTTVLCPYKGTSTYWHAVGDGDRITADVGWAYEDPLDDAARVAGHVCFAPSDDVTLEVDGTLAQG